MEVHLFLMRLFFSQTNLISLSNKPKRVQCLLAYWIVFAAIYLPFYLLITDILWILKFIQYLYIFLYKNL